MNASCTPVNAIPAAIYDGYLWYADRESPDVYKARPFDAGALTEQPFVVEGWLKVPDRNESYAVRYFDGCYYLTRYTWEDGAHYRSYVGHDLDDDQFYVVEHWEAQPDPLCEDMHVLQPAWVAFAGFDSAKIH